VNTWGFQIDDSTVGFCLQVVIDNQIPLHCDKPPPVKLYLCVPTITMSLSVNIKFQRCLARSTYTTKFHNHAITVITNLRHCGNTFTSIEFSKLSRTVFEAGG